MLSPELDEVNLLRASTLVDEFEWHGTHDEVKAWEEAINDNQLEDIQPMAFTLKLSPALRLMVQYGVGMPRMTLKGPSLSKTSMQEASDLLAQLSQKALAESGLAAYEIG